MRTTHRRCGGPVDSAEDLSAQRRTPRLSGGPINDMQDPSTMQRAYRQCGGPSEDAGANDSMQGSTMSSTAWPCAFSLFFFSLKNYIHVPKHIPKEGLLGEQ